MTSKLMLFNIFFSLPTKFTNFSNIIKCYFFKCLIIALFVVKDLLHNSHLNGFWTEIILHSDKDGIFKDVDIVKCLLTYLIEKDIWVKQGDLVNKFTGANQTIGTLIFKFKEKNQMLLFSDKIDEYIKVIVE